MSSFHNRKRAAQLVDFAGLSWGKLRPTDIDLSLDWGGKTFVFVELKGHGKPLTVGQRIHLEGLVRAIRAGGRTAWAVVAHHSTKAHEDIQAAECIVHSCYDGNVWDSEYTNQELSCTLNDLNEIHRQEYPK